ncbi:ABC transporter substrate-binding protein [uncultured Alsobacter sp.]|uniref:ABC transporter substrate-binding protein n=1 Tax=uncultured Alsobacter sp. TaxID=1748258 RepID=UPI0025E6D8B0|nr:ABC transporter substrate-binding protein [uncultured Alsobacter sp.]
MQGSSRRQALAGLMGAVAVAALSAGSAAAGEKITMWHIFGNATEPALANLAKWDKLNPDNPLDHKFIPFGQLSQQLIKGIATGDVPDLITIDNPVVASFASQGALEDLTEMVKASKVIKKDGYFPGSWNTTIWNGKQFAVPGEANTLALYYNADMFRAKGLDPDRPPRTWAELKAASEKLTDPAKNVYGIGFSAIQSEEGTFQWLPFLQQSGGNLRDLTSADSVAALALWADWVKSGQASKDVLVKRQFEMTSAFLGGGSAMVVSGPWELQRMDKDAKFEWRVAVLPVREGKNIEASALGGYVWGVPKGAKNPKLAFKVIEFMSEPEQMKQAWSGGRLPPVASIAIDNPSNPKAYEVFKRQMEFAKARGPHPAWPQISAAVQTAIQSALTGQATPAAALEKAQAVVKPLLDKNPIDGL